MNNRKRNVQIKFRVTEEERSLIEEKMKQVPTSNMETYLRKMAIDGYIIQVDHSDIRKMTAELQKIGININQHMKSGRGQVVNGAELHRAGVHREPGVIHHHLHVAPEGPGLDRKSNV